MSLKNPKHKYDFVGKCPIVYAVELLGSKWKLPILWFLSERSELHYNELQRGIRGITTTALTRCLRELEEAHVIIRNSNASVPPSVTYRLSDIGAKLIPALDGLYEWGEEYMEYRKDLL